MSLVYAFREEVEKIQDERMRNFLVDSLDCVPEFYESMTDLIEQTKKAFEITMILGEEMDSSDIALDILGVACLLQDCTRYDYINDGQGEWYPQENLLHPLSVRVTLAPLQTAIDRDLFHNIMLLIESSHGFNSPIPQVEPEVNSPAHVWIIPFANRLAKEMT